MNSETDDDVRKKEEKVENLLMIESLKVVCVSKVAIVVIMLMCTCPKIGSF